jgi:hypothetical protein
MDGEMESEKMRASMQAVTSFELEAVRRQEVLLADAGTWHASAEARLRSWGRPGGSRRSGALAEGLATMVARRGSPAAGRTQP